MSVAKLWRAVDGADRFALEISAGADGEHHPADLSRLVTGRKRRPAFLILNPDLRSPVGLEGLAAAVAKAKLSTHVAIAVDHLALQCVGMRRMPDQFGLILDIHDDGVPFSALADQRIEAVRFSATYARRVGASLRAACVFNAMLTLSRELGLATLGPSLTAGRRASIGDMPFDYTDGMDVRKADVAVRPAPDFELSR